jgi:hypothetical protein
LDENPLLEPLENLFHRLVMLTGLVHIVEDQLHGYRRLFTSQFEEVDRRHVFAGFNLIVWDIAPRESDQPRHWRPVSSFSAGGEHYLQLTELFVRREASWTVSQVYEAFETYLKDILATYLSRHPDASQAISFRQPDDPSNAASWRVGLRSARWTSVKLLASLRQIEPSIAAREAANDRQMDMNEWHQVLQEVRHASTHTHMRIRNYRMAHWSPAKKRILRRKFPGQPQNGDYALDLTRESAQSAVQTAADYAFLIFKCLSQSCSYDWDILGAPSTKPSA